MVFEDLLQPFLAPLARATILVDAGHLAATWGELVAEPERLRRANRRYLVRGVEVPGRAFHAKTYFFGEQGASHLLVGSGNLTFNGIMAGRETFAAYDSRDPSGSLALRSWHAWMTRIVSSLGDDAVTERWKAIDELVPKQHGDAAHGPLVHNLDVSLLDQLIASSPAAIDKLIVMAPFHDEDLSAIGRLEAALKPRTIDLYLCERAKIDGVLLANKVRSSTVPVRLLRPAPGEFVHAKLFGVVRGDRGWLLSGSANCSDVALCFSGRSANVECGSLIELPASLVLSAFQGPFKTAELAIDNVIDLRWEDDGAADPLGTLPLSLRSATHLPDGRIEVRFLGIPPGPIWILSADGARTGPLHLFSSGSNLRDGLSDAVPAEQAIAIALADSGGTRLSNWVPVDWPSALEGRDPEATRTPDGLAEEDFRTEYGRALAWLDEGMNYDVLLGSPGGTLPVSLPVRADRQDGTIPVQHQGDLNVPWRPRHLERLRGLTGVPSLDDALRELDIFRDRVPGIPREPQLNVIPSEDDEEFSPTGASEEESERDQAVAAPSTTAGRRRFANALDRRCWAAGNRRLFEEDTASAIRYIARLLSLLDGINGDPARGGWVSEAQMVRLVDRLLRSLVGRPGMPGLITVLEDSDRKAVIEGLGPEGPIRFGRLVLWCIQPGIEGWRDRRFASKESIALGIEIGCLNANPDDADQLLAAATIMDDEHWPHEAKKASGIRVTVRRLQSMVRLELSLGNADRLFTDPAVPRLMLSWTSYAGAIDDPVSPDLLLAVPGDDQGRISFQHAEAFAKRHGQMLPKGIRVTQSLLSELATSGSTLGHLFDVEPAVESA